MKTKSRTTAKAGKGSNPGNKREQGQRKRARDALRQSEERFAKAFRSSPVAIIISRVADGKFIDVNDAACQIYGYTREELLGHTSLEMKIITAEERLKIVDALQSQGVLRDLEVTVHSRSAGARVVLCSMELLEMDGEQCMLTVMIDITERKRVEEALKESEERFSTAFFTSPISQSIIAQGTNEIMAVNDACCRLFGYPREELIGASTAKLNLWEDPADRMAAVEELQTTDHLTPREATIRVKSGEIRTVIVAIEPIAWKGLPCLISSVFDITERKRAEIELMQMKRLYATLSQVNQTIVRVKNRQELFDSICKVAVEFGGFRLVWIGLLDPQTGQITLVAEHGQGQNKLPFQSINAKDDPYQSGLIGLSLQSGLVQSSEDIQVDARMAHWRAAAIQGNYHSAAAVPFRQNGKIIGLLNLYAADIGFFTIKEEQRLLEKMGLDISFALDNMDGESRHRQAEDEQFRLMQVLESSLNEIYIFDDTSLQFTYVNQGALRNLGYSMEELRSMTPIDLKPEFTEELFRDMIRPLVLREKDTLVFETVHRRKNGMTYPAEVHLQLVETQGSRNFVAIIHDITEHKQAEQTLRESEERLRLSLHAANQGLYDLNVQTGNAIVNREYAEMLGYDPETFVETNAAWIERLHPDDREVTAKVYSDYINGLLPEYRVEFRQRMKDGNWKWILSLGQVTEYDAEGKPLRMLGTHTDITERKRAEERIKTQLERLASLRAIDAAITSSTNLNMTFYVLLTQAMTRLKIDAAAVLVFNPVTNELEVYTRQGFYAPDRQMAHVRMGENIAGQCAFKRAPLEDHFLTKEKFSTIDPSLMEEGFTCYLAIPLINKAKVLGVLEVFERGHRPHDQDWVDFLNALAGQAAIAIDNFQLFDGLQRANTMLERRVAERTRDLYQANAELEHANRAKDEFLATMSHELRTPLNSVLGLSESLLEQRRGPLNEYQQKALQIIEASGHHLLDLINDILDLSKIDAGKFDIYPQIVEVNTLCQSSLTFVRQQATRKSISLLYEEDKTISKFQADPRRVKQILVNLLTNAVKFTPEGGHVTLQVRASAEQDLVQFSVIDNGIGIAPEDLKRLFQPFVQVDSHLNRQFDGTGLGLALVQKLVDLHGGSVQVESEVNKGSRFTVNLPWQRDIPEAKETANSKLEPLVTAPEGKPKFSSDGTSNQKVILLAEDSMANILTIGEYLESHGYDVAFARDGWEAISKAEEINPDIILMDIQMPSLDGLEATRRLRANPSFATTPIIALTALAMSGDRERCLAAGANEYMSKPVKLERLVKIIEIMLEPGKNISQ